MSYDVKTVKRFLTILTLPNRGVKFCKGMDIDEHYIYSIISIMILTLFNTISD